MQRQSRTDERRDNGNISSLIAFELRISRKSKRRRGGLGKKMRGTWEGGRTWAKVEGKKQEEVQSLEELSKCKNLTNAITTTTTTTATKVWRIALCGSWKK